MGRREIIITGLYAAVALGGGSLVGGYSMTANGYTPWLIGLGWSTIFLALVGLARMYWTAPKALMTSFGQPDREFLPEDITTDVLRRKVEGRTDVQITALAKTYVGKWMKMEGRVVNVTDLGGLSAEKWMLHLAEDGRAEKYSSVAVVFRKVWHSQLGALNKQDWVSVVACISGLQQGPMFDHGEIVHMGEPPKKAEPKPRAPRKKAAPKASAH